MEEGGTYLGLIFYADDGLISLTHLEWLQGEFDTLMGLFGQVGLRENVGKTIGMIFQPYHAFRTQSEAADKSRIT